MQLDLVLLANLSYRVGNGQLSFDSEGKQIDAEAIIAWR
jgi:hypothetical protein